MSRKDPREAKVQDLLNRATTKASKDFRQLLQIYTELIDYIPDYSRHIAHQLVKQLTQFLGPSGATPIAELISKALDLLVKAMESIDPGRPETNPVKVLVGDVNFLRALLQNTRQIEPRVIHLIARLSDIAPLEVKAAIGTNHELLFPLVDAVALSKNERAAEVLKFWALFSADLTQSLLPVIKKHLKKFPVSVALDFMIASDELSNVIPKEELESWLLTSTKFSILDLEQVFAPHLAGELWERPVSVTLLNRSYPPETPNHVRWIHNMSPQRFEASSSERDKAADTVIEPFAEGPTPPKDSVAAYLFVRLYILSLSSPIGLDHRAVDRIVRFTTDESDWIAGGALQVLYIWIAKFQLEVRRELVYFCAAAAVDETRSESVRALHRAMLHAIGKQHAVAASILMSDPAMRFESQAMDRVMGSQWAFPQLAEHLGRIGDLHLVDHSEACKVLGYVMTFLEAVEPGESDPRA
jgi:hypothetical protein